MSSMLSIHLRNGVEITDPVRVVLGYVEAWRFEAGDMSASFAEPDLRLANRGGARISAVEIAAVLERRRTVERALRAVPVRASLAGAARSVPWVPLRNLFDATDVRECVEEVSQRHPGHRACGSGE